MQLQNKLTMLISSCENFSDLWDLHFEFLRKNWLCPEMPVILNTDKPTQRSFDGVQIVSGGEERQWSERLQHAVSFARTEYVFVTLDDYFVVTPVDLEKIAAILQMMEEENLDYVRLSGFVKHPRRDRLPGRKKTWFVDTQNCYSVNLTAGIWRKSFLEKTFREPKNAWQYEVSLAAAARQANARCAQSADHDYRYLDVVRKGKLLNKANRYFKKHNLYHGDRPVISPWYEVKIFLRTWCVRLMPRRLSDFVRGIMKKHGHRYYSQEG